MRSFKQKMAYITIVLGLSCGLVLPTMAADFATTKAMASKGNMEAQRNLGTMYSNGEEVPRDYKKSIEWYTKAANQGDAISKHELGDMYSNGEGVIADYITAIEWYQSAADQSYALVEKIKLSDSGIKEDKKNFDKYQIAADQGNVYAQYKIGEIYKHDKQYRFALKWFQKAINLEGGFALYSIGEMYSYGLGVRQNYTEAFKWYEKAAYQGHGLAKYKLGDMYSSGVGVPQDYSQAVTYYSIASHQAHSIMEDTESLLRYSNSTLGTNHYFNRYSNKKMYGESCDEGNQHACDSYRLLNEQQQTWKRRNKSQAR